MIKYNRARLYVGGLDYNTTHQELSDLFLQNGIEPMKLEFAWRRECARLGYGFVTVAREDVEKAIRSLNGKSFRGRTLGIEIARPKNRGRRWLPYREYLAQKRKADGGER